jgi:ribosome-associated heat shock protein Hsp15
MSDSIRLDKWLWAARFFKTRSLASEAIALGRVSVNGAPAKASREVRPGDRIGVRRVGSTQWVDVRAVSAQRGPASVAQRLYQETPESLAERERQAQQRREAPEPAAALNQGRPTKRDRRDLADWQRWSASTDD